MKNTILSLEATLEQKGDPKVTREFLEGILEEVVYGHEKCNRLEKLENEVMKYVRKDDLNQQINKHGALKNVK